MTRMGMLAVLVLLLAGCAQDSREPAPDSTPSSSDAAAPGPAPSPSLTRAPRGRVDVAYSSPCQDELPTVYVLGDQTENTATGYRFIGDVTVVNRGEVRASVLVDFRWLLVGGEIVRTDDQRVELDPGEEQTLGFTQLATQDQIQRMQAHGPGDALCEAGVLSGRA